MEEYIGGLKCQRDCSGVYKCIVSDVERVILLLREAPVKDTPCSNGILPDSVSTPPPRANGRFVAGIFRQKLANSLKQRF